MQKINLGCGHNHLNGFLNIDKFMSNKPDVCCDLEHGLPFKDNSIDEVFAIHVMEHISNLMNLMRDIYRVCKNGVKCFFVTPYKTSFEAMGNPHHLRVFDEWSWYYFTPELYDNPTTSGYAYMGLDFTFKIDKIELIPYPEFLNDKELDWKKNHWWNVIREVHGYLEVVKNE